MFLIYISRAQFSTGCLRAPMLLCPGAQTLGCQILFSHDLRTWLLQNGCYSSAAKMATKYAKIHRYKLADM